MYIERQTTLQFFSSVLNIYMMQDTVAFLGIIYAI